MVVSPCCQLRAWDHALRTTRRWRIGHTFDYNTLTARSRAPYDPANNLSPGGNMRLTLQLLLAMTLLPSAIAQAQTPTATPAGPIHVATYIEVGTGSVKEGIALLKQYRDATAKEAGSTRIGVGQEVGRANRFVGLEIWK